MTPGERQAVVDEEHLWLLSLFHYISGGMGIAGALMAGGWAVVMGVMFSTMPPPDGANEAMAEQFQAMPLIMAVMVGTFAALLLTYGVTEIVVGRLITQRRARIFTLIVGLPRMAFFPYGTILTALTFVVLDRASVQQLYRARIAATATSHPSS